MLRQTLTVPFESSIEKNLYKILVPAKERTTVHEKIREIFQTNNIVFTEKMTSESGTITTFLFPNKTKLVVKPIGASKNEGIKFESDFQKYFQSYLLDGSYSDIFSQLSQFGINLSELKMTSGKRHRRPLVFSAEGISVGTLEPIGNIIGDVITIEPLQTNYLSLKDGASVCFSNNGVKKFLLEEEIKNYQIQNQNALAFLDFFKLDAQLFCSVYNQRNSGIKNEVIVSPTPNSAIQTFLKSAVGYGYIYVHRIGNSYSFKDFRDVSHLDEITTILNYTVRYPIGIAKTVYIAIETPKVVWDIQIRNKKGGLYPNEIITGYKWKQ